MHVHAPTVCRKPSAVARAHPSSEQIGRLLYACASLWHAGRQANAHVHAPAVHRRAAHVHVRTSSACRKAIANDGYEQGSGLQRNTRFSAGLNWFLGSTREEGQIISEISQKKVVSIIEGNERGRSGALRRGMDQNVVVLVVWKATCDRRGRRVCREHEARSDPSGEGAGPPGTQCEGAGGAGEHADGAGPRCRRGGGLPTGPPCGPHQQSAIFQSITLHYNFLFLWFCEMVMAQKRGICSH